MRQITRANCPICDSTDIVHSAAHRQYYVRAFRKVIHIYFGICRGCGFIHQQNPLDDESLSYYYANNNQPRDLDVTAVEHVVHDKQMAFMGDVSGTRVLEIGSSAGKFLNDLKQRGAVTFYDELNPEATALLDQNGHSPMDAGPFDVVVMRHVLEHIPDPVGYLTALAPKISGSLFVEVPDWSFLDRFTDTLNFEHINHFTPTTLFMALNRAGFAPYKMEIDRTENYSTTPNRVIRVLSKPRPPVADSFTGHLRDTEGRYLAVIDEMIETRGPDWKLGLYAASWLAEMVLTMTAAKSLRNLRLFDKDPRKQAEPFYDLTVEPPESILENSPETVLILSSYNVQISADLQRLGYKGEVLSFFNLAD